MKKIIFAILIAAAIPSTSFAAISFDTSIDSGISGTSPLVTGMTLAGSATLLYCAAIGQSVTSMTYNGVNMTKLNDIGVDTGARHIASWYLMNPPTGSNNVAATFTGDTFYDCSSYIGVGGIDSDTTASGTPPLTVTLTTSNDNDWTVLGARGATGGTLLSSTSGANQREENTGIGSILLDNGPVTPAGSTNIGVTSGDAYLIATMMSFYPITTSTPSSSPATTDPMNNRSSTAAASATVAAEIVAFPLYIYENYGHNFVMIAVLFALVGAIYGIIKLVTL